MATEIDITEECIVINASPVDRQVSPDVFRTVLGNSYRTHEYGPPAPLGHSNNKALIYDDLGIYLFQHHATGLIRGISIILKGKRLPFAVGTPFHGKLIVLGRTMPERPTTDDIPQRILSEGKQFDNIFNLRLDNVAITFEATPDGNIDSIEVSFRR